jgi:Prokaryotic RING finger family 1
MTPVLLVAALIGVIGLLAWMFAGLLETAAEKFYHSYEFRQKVNDQDLISGSVGCPYCKSSLFSDDAIISCNECGTLHHYECWETQSFCSVYGCEGARGKLV